MAMFRKGDCMRQHKTLADAIGLIFVIRNPIVKGEGTHCKKLQRSWKCSKTFGGIIAPTVVNNFPLTFVMLATWIQKGIPVATRILLVISA